MKTLLISTRLDHRTSKILAEEEDADAAYAAVPAARARSAPEGGGATLSLSRGRPSTSGSTRRRLRSSHGRMQATGRRSSSSSNNNNNAPPPPPPDEEGHDDGGPAREPEPARPTLLAHPLAAPRSSTIHEGRRQFMLALAAAARPEGFGDAFADDGALAMGATLAMGTTLGASTLGLGAASVAAHAGPQSAPALGRSASQLVEAFGLSPKRYGVYRSATMRVRDGWM